MSQKTIIQQHKLIDAQNCCTATISHWKTSWAIQIMYLQISLKRLLYCIHRLSIDWKEKCQCFPFVIVIAVIPNLTNLYLVLSLFGICRTSQTVTFPSGRVTCRSISASNAPCFANCRANTRGRAERILTLRFSLFPTRSLTTMTIGDLIIAHDSDLAYAFSGFLINLE